MQNDWSLGCPKGFCSRTFGLRSPQSFKTSPNVLRPRTTVPYRFRQPLNSTTTTPLATQTRARESKGLGTRDSGIHPLTTNARRWKAMAKGGGNLHAPPRSSVMVILKVSHGSAIFVSWAQKNMQEWGVSNGD